MEENVYVEKYQWKTDTTSRRYQDQV